MELTISQYQGHEEIAHKRGKKDKTTIKEKILRLTSPHPGPRGNI